MKNFKGAVIKFHKLFNLPPEEKLVNCKWSIDILPNAAFLTCLYWLSPPIHLAVTALGIFGRLLVQLYQA